MITIAVCSILLLVAFLLAPSGWSDVLSSARNELVFTDRNRAYGAYVLRREHHRVLFISVALGLGGFVGLLIVPALLAGTPSLSPLPPPQATDDVLICIVTPPDPLPVRPSPRPRSTLPAVTSGYKAVDTTTTEIDTTATSVSADPAPTAPVDPVGTGLPASGSGGGSTMTEIDSLPTFADVAPEYPGGMSALYRDIGDMIHYPETDRNLGRQGEVKLVFVVSADGRVSDVQVVRGVSPTIDAEAVRVFKRLKRWKPGTFQGRPVNTRYSIPIKFTLR
jgi:protein TonB